MGKADVADIGTHWLDTLTWITGLQVTAVMADLATFIGTRLRPLGEVDTYAGKMLTPDQVEEIDVHTEDYAILLRFDDGTRGAVTIS
jgi:predicted dehydrogenase